MTEDFSDELMRFVLAMRQEGVTDHRALSALELTPRAHFAPPHLADRALDDVDLPLPCDQVMTRPSVVGRMIMALEPMPEDSVLEIGAGSGYQAAVLGQLARRVITIDRYGMLAAAARTRLAAVGLDHVEAQAANGVFGWPEQAPYDRIVVNAAARVAPFALLDQLAPGGVLVIPIGEGGGVRLMRFRSGAGSPEDLGRIAFAALEEEDA
jgi:protein-L-isoaspartate(D-aspartate) O-methyltransferase